MPVLPTRDSKMNNLICRYNTHVFSSEFRRRLGVTMPPLYSFLDSKHILSLHLTRYKGISMFVRVIKEAIFRCNKTGQGNYNKPEGGLTRPPYKFMN